MKSKLWRRVASVALCSLLPAAIAGADSFTEDFTTTTFKDDVHTTANWNTAAAELSLFPFNINQTGSFNTTGNAFGVAVDGDLAFVADQLSGLQVIEITDPANPTLVGTLDTPVSALGVAVDGNHAFVADSSTGLLVIDVTDPSLPALLGTYDTPGFAGRVVVAGDLAFVADYNGGLQIVDVSNPLLPAGIGSLSTLGNVNDVVVDGDHAYLADDTLGLVAVDISDPSNPISIGILTTGGGALGLAVDGDHVFLADDTLGLQIIDVSDPASPSLAGSFNTPNRARGVAVAGNQAYVSDGTTGLMVIDISNPLSPTLRSTFNTTGTARDVAVAGNLAFVAGDSGGLQVIEVSAPSHLILSGSADLPGSSWDVEAVGNYAYVASAGLQVVDITDPHAPFVAGSNVAVGGARGVTVAGNHAFLSKGPAGLSVVDISDPTSPVLLSTIETPGFARRVAVAGDLAFVADEVGGGLRIFDISNPASPVFLGANTAIAAYDIVLAGDHAFIADNSSGLRVVNVSDPTNPTLVATLAMPSQTQGLAISGNHVFMAAFSSVVVVDVSDPANPVEVSSLPTDYAFCAEVEGNYLMVGHGGVIMLDISDPLNPFILSQYDGPPGDGIPGMAMSGEYLLGAHDDLGVTVLRAFQDEVVTTIASGRSLEIDESTDSVIRARVSPVESPGVSWELSANGGTDFQLFSPDAWSTLAQPGAALLWRSNHVWEPGVNPTVSDVTLEWLHEFGNIAAIADVPDDQGGRVYIDVNRSGHDFADELSIPVTQYGIYRRVDDGVLIGNMDFKEDSGQGAASRPGIVVPAGVSSTWIGDQLYVMGSEGRAKATTFPPGTWALVGSIPATQSDGYLVEATTVADSSGTGPALASFLVTTHTTVPSVWFVSQPDSGYSVDNIAPAIPENLVLNGTQLSWDASPDQDFQYFSVFGSASEEFDGGAIHIGDTIQTTLDISDETFPYFHLTASDYSGNQSDAATLHLVSPVPVPSGKMALYPAVPNPFNPETRISFEMASSARARLTVYDAAGRLVTTLVDERREAGRHDVVWYGRDDAGRNSPTGVYLYRLEIGDFVETKRMTLVK